MSSAQPVQPAKQSFRELVGVSELSKKWDWGVPEWVALLSVPAIFLTAGLVGLFTKDPSALAISDTALRILIFVILVVANHRTLGTHWKAFLRGGWRSWLLVIGGMVVLQLSITLVRTIMQALGANGSAVTESDAATTAAITGGVLAFAALGPIVTALIEDFAFRHTLLVRLPVWGSAVAGFLLTIVNAIVFGLVHINNFDGNWLGTLTYAAPGLIMNVVYLWTRNIWHVLLMHGLNNALLAGAVGVAALLGVL